jgi:hypothetical protein
MNSLVWENAAEDDTLYYYDSVLTLSQSNATLYLHEQTEVHLFENTLVTIEPQSANNDSEIRLKFTRGDLRARNPSATTKIETQEWSLNLNQGSEVSLRQTGKDDFEVEVLKGNLEFQKDSSTQSLSQNQVLKIEDNKVAGTLAIQSDLKFQGPDYQRFYSYQPQAQVPVSWKGDAEQIQILPLGQDKILKTVPPGQSMENLALEPGKYSLRLLKQGKVSEAKEIEVWKAPTLHLLSPFPRDRVKTHDNIAFIWTYLPEAKEYKFIMTDMQTGHVTEKTVKENSLNFVFSDEADVQWKVIGIDLDGFEMPAPYANQIFPRHEPFAAPKLKSPELRVPASKPAPEEGAEPKKAEQAKSKTKSKDKAKKKSSHGAWWMKPASSPLASFILQSIFGEDAHAESKKPTGDYEAVFAWEPVDGADAYTIEISDTADFRSPRVSKTVKKTEFVWSQFPLGSYFWRVAAGSSKGRMGVFSEPAIVQLEKLPENNSTSNNDGVLIRKKIDPEKNRAPVQTKTEEIFKEAPKPQFDEKLFEKDVKLVSDDQRNLKDSYLYEWSPLMTNWALNGTDQLKAKLNGSTTGAGHFQTEQILSRDQSYFIDAFYAQYKWKAADLTTYPFQEDQSFTDARVQVLFGNNKSGLLRGGIVQMLPYIARKGDEDIELKSALSIGPAVTYNWTHSERFLSGHSLSFMAGSSLFAFSTQNIFRYLFYKGESSAFSIGFRVQDDVVFYQRSFSNGWGAGLTLGFEN